MDSVCQGLTPTPPAPALRAGELLAARQGSRAVALLPVPGAYEELRGVKGSLRRALRARP